MKDNGSMLILLVLASAAIVFGFDVLTPFGIGEWILYLLPLLFSTRIKRPNFPIVYASVCILLLALGFFFHPGAGLLKGFSLISRGLGALALMATAITLTRHQATETALRQSETRFASF